MNAVEIANLQKNFGRKQAVQGLNMTVPEGAIYGFIGENGSGKSTTEKLICGLIRPSGGSIRLFGKDYTDGDTRAKIGVLIESHGCFLGATVWNNMMMQTMGKTVPATILAASRQGLFFIPALLILPQFLGLTGIQCAQAVSDVFTFALTTLLNRKVMRSLNNR